MADAGLARISAHAQRLLQLQRAFESATPLARHARIANLRLGKVLIHAANAAVAAKLRQLAPRLATVFQVVAAEVTGIDIRVQLLPITNRKPTDIRRAPIGAQQKHGLTSLADQLPEGSPLRSALRRLVHRT